MPNVTSEILEKQPFSTASVACGCCSKTASKKSPAGGKHRASEGRASSETTPKKCLTSLLKSSKNNLFSTASVACGCCSKTASKKSPAGEKTPCLWRTSKFQNHAKKVPNVTSEIVEKQDFSLASEGRASSKTTPKKSLTCRLKSEKKQHFWRASVACGGSQSNSFEKISSRKETPCLWRTS